jgi:hypothetical protein
VSSPSFDRAAVAALVHTTIGKPVSATDFSAGRFLHSSVRDVNLSPALRGKFKTNENVVFRYETDVKTNI